MDSSKFRNRVIEFTKLFIWRLDLLLTPAGELLVALPVDVPVQLVGVLALPVDVLVEYAVFQLPPIARLKSPGGHRSATTDKFQLAVLVEYYPPKSPTTILKSRTTTTHVHLVQSADISAFRLNATLRANQGSWLTKLQKPKGFIQNPWQKRDLGTNHPKTAPIMALFSEQFLAGR
jgi:hypothetical protein